MQYEALRKRARDLGVSMRRVYGVAGIPVRTWFRHKHHLETPREKTLKALDEALALIASGQTIQRGHWSQRVKTELVRLRRFRGMTQGDVEDLIGVTGALVGKWECGMRNPHAFLLTCWAEALDAHVRVIPDELAGEVDALLERFYAQA